MKQYKAWELLPEEKVYLKSEVEEAIAELKKFAEDACLERDDNQSAIDELQSENDQLKAKLESVQASAYADSVDAGMRERRLRRALWLTRSERAIEKIAWFKLWNGSISTMNPEDGARQEYDKWNKNFVKFLKKAEEYK